MQQSSSLSSISGSNLQPASTSISAPFSSFFYLLSPRRYHSSPSSAYALRQDSRTTTAITTMWVWEGARGEKDGVIMEEGEEKDKAQGEKLQFSLQRKENVHHIDVQITRRTSKTHNAVLEDLLTRHAAVVRTDAMLHFDQGEHTNRYSVTKATLSVPSTTQ